MFFDNDNALFNYEKCQRLKSHDPCDLPLQVETPQEEVTYSLTMPLGSLCNQLERLKLVTIEWQGETSELDDLQRQIIALQNSVKCMIRKTSDELVREWNELI